MKDTYTFGTVQELKDFLNQFTVTDLTAIYPSCNGSDYLTIVYDDETLTDGSKNITMDFK